MKHLLYISFFLFCFATSNAQNDLAQETNVLFVVDGSSSMLKKWGRDSKWDIAKSTLIEIADSLRMTYPNLEIGLRVYGHQSLPVKSDCEDTELKVPIGKVDLNMLKGKLNEVSPKGITPLAYTLEQVQKDFEGTKGEKNILILITDGAESCQGDPCKILGMLIESEVIVKPVVIGLDIPISSLAAYHCVKDVYNPQTQEDFSSKMLRLIHQSIRFTSVQIALLDSKGEPKQSDLPMLIYDSEDQEVDYYFYHKLDENGNPDTLYVDPTVEYYVEVQTIPPVKSPVVKLNANKHNWIPILASTGDLRINKVDVQGSTVKQIPSTPYFIKRSGEENYLYSSFIDRNQEYLMGTYDIDVLTLPPTHLKNVSIKGDQLNNIQIPASGKLTINARFPIHGGVFQTINNELINIFTFEPNTKQEIIDLQPGKYSVIYRFDHKREMHETKEIEIEINSLDIKEIKI